MTLSDLVKEVREEIRHDAVSVRKLAEVEVYVNAIATYLGLGVSRLSDIFNALCRWENTKTQVRNLFARQAIPMLWDFAEPNALGSAAGDYSITLKTIIRVISNLGQGVPGLVAQQDAITFVINENEPHLVFTTDPPYYDNISYAELSDFFYVWMRRSIGDIYPDLFSTLATPKEQELIAAPHRFGGSKEKARQFFEEGLRKAFKRTYEASHRDYPFTVFYAFKQTETNEDESGSAFKLSASTGWDTMLESLIQSGFSVTGTWPMRTELGNRPVASGTNALATSIALVCRPLPADAPKTTRRNFVNELKRELPAALRAMQQGNIAPVDLAQASIGPGMAVFSRYKQVLESDGTPMRVRTALQLINQTLDEYFTEQEGEFDADTRWALTWFEQHQFEDGSFGDAETLSKAKVTSVQGLASAGILAAKAGKVRLLRRDELPHHWNPTTDLRVPVWEATQHLIHALDRQGESGAANLMEQLGDRGQFARDLAYRLYSICDRKGWTQEAIAYNSLVTSWSEISRLTATRQPEKQGALALGI
jgi:putative DNA methylase